MTQTRHAPPIAPATPAPAPDLLWQPPPWRPRIRSALWTPPTARRLCFAPILKVIENVVLTFYFTCVCFDSKPTPSPPSRRPKSAMAPSQSHNKKPSPSPTRQVTRLVQLDHSKWSSKLSAPSIGGRSGTRGGAFGTETRKRKEKKNHQGKFGNRFHHPPAARTCATQQGNTSKYTHRQHRRRGQ